MAEARHGPGTAGSLSWRDALRRPPQFEVIPLAGAAQQVLLHLPPGSRVTVTSSPVQGPEATLALARALAEQGFTAVPHLAARRMRDPQQLREIVTVLQDSGITEVFVIAGDAVQPSGPFPGALELLTALKELNDALTIGIGAHPEGHPFVGETEDLQLFERKTVYASYIVTQMCFAAEPLREWVRRLRNHGITIPVRPGIPGPVSLSRLLRIAGRIGVGRSLRLLTKHGTGITTLLGPKSWSPDPLLDDLAPLLADPACAVDGLHVYTFNAIEQCAAWWSGGVSIA